MNGMPPIQQMHIGSACDETQRFPQLGVSLFPRFLVKMDKDWTNLPGNKLNSRC